MYHANLNVLSAEKFTTPTTTDNSLSPSIKWYRNSDFSLVFKGAAQNKKTKLRLPPIE